MTEKRILSAIIFLLLLTFSGQAQISSRKIVGSNIIDAVAAIDNREIDKAEAILKAILADNPNDDSALYYMGMCGLYRNSPDVAKECFKKASELDPKNYWYRDRLAMAYSLSGENDLTIATYEALLKDFPKKNEIYFSLVNLYLRENDTDKALGALDQIEAVFGKTETVTSTKYDIYLRKNQPEEAFKALESFNEEYSSAEILSKMGDHSMAEYKDSAALAYYDEALSIQEDYVPALLGKAEVYRTRRSYPEFFTSLDKFISSSETPSQTKAQYMNMLLSRSEPSFLRNFTPQIDSTMDKLVATHPQDSTTLGLAGMYYFSTARLDKAKEMFAKDKELHPESIGAQATYIQMLGYEQDFDGMIAECDKALEKFPGEMTFFDLKNSACYNKQDYQGIIDNCTSLVSMFPDDTSKTIPAMSMMGDMYHELGNEKEAFRNYKEVLKLNPDYVPVLNNYAYYLAINGKSLKKALAMSRKTIDKEPDNPTYLDTYGWILHLLGKDEEAKTTFKHAMIYGGKESATALEHYSIVLDALGEKDLAEVYRTQAQARREEGKE